MMDASRDKENEETSLEMVCWFVVGIIMVESENVAETKKFDYEKRMLIVFLCFYW